MFIEKTGIAIVILVTILLMYISSMLLKEGVTAIGVISLLAFAACIYLYFGDVITMSD